VPASDDEVDVDFVLMDEDFHERVAAAAGNAALVGQLHKVNERIRLVRMQDFLTVPRVTQTIEQHLGVLDPLIGGDLLEAEARLIGHFAESLAVVEERAAVTIARMLERSRG
jgi:DNA-binding GntR family transcriptional regulator